MPFHICIPPISKT